ncbi:MAG: 50S ribosomal protein L2 [Brumimicrobium sp.]|nr:50S ribosomal protein L2 [Brumimicrobium sp.]MCO5267872.1 50S ribosomal protein L2 [Brumimicrobium sp.]
MSLKKFKPTTPGQRRKIILDSKEITKSTPEKSLISKKSKTGGRNSKGRMTMRYIGGGHKQKYRIIDFKRDKMDIPATVKAIEYDPNRTANIALLFYKDGEKRYILAPDGLKVGDEVLSGKNATPNIGNAMFVADIPLGTSVHNVEMKPGNGGVIARGAGTYAVLMARDGKYGIFRMPSGEVRMILTTCLATIGTVSNHEHSLTVSGKAGRSRWLGRRPRVRGVVMNPVDHPMGGGEGRHSGGHPRSRNGIPAKGYKTRAPKKYSNKFIIEKRKK